jgi:uncharacterized membrane protein (DUF106 family)
MQEATSRGPGMNNKTMIGVMASMMIMMVVMMFRGQIGSALDFVFRFVAFDGKYPVLTLVIAGLIAFTISNIIRTYMTDPVKMARNQHIQSEFNKEFRQARIENNLFKMKKLEEMQPKIMEMSMESSMSQMKTMPITMLIVIPVYAWIYFFIDPSISPYFPDGLTVLMPWGEMDPNMRLMGFMPMWIILYTLISMPIGQIETRLIRYFLLKKRLAVLDQERAVGAE